MQLAGCYNEIFYSLLVIFYLADRNKAIMIKIYSLNHVLNGQTHFPTQDQLYFFSFEAAHGQLQLDDFGVSILTSVKKL